MAHLLKGKPLYAYIAGIIDGEGAIGICSQGKRTKHPNYSIRVYVGNTNEWLIQWLHLQFGGHIGLDKRVEGHKDLWRWEIRARKAIDFLALIVPYLQLKRPQAELALNLDKQRSKLKLNDPKRKALWEADKITMASYNQRGIKQEGK